MNSNLLTAPRPVRLAIGSALLLMATAVLGQSAGDATRVPPTITSCITRCTTTAPP